MRAARGEDERKRWTMGREDMMDEGMTGRRQDDRTRGPQWDKKHDGRRTTKDEQDKPRTKQLPTGHGQKTQTDVSA